MTARWLQDDCKMTARWLQDDCKMTARWLQDDIDMKNHRNIDARWLQHHCKMTARWLQDDCKMIARWLQDDFYCVEMYHRSHLLCNTIKSFLIDSLLLSNSNNLVSRSSFSFSVLAYLLSNLILPFWMIQCFSCSLSFLLTTASLSLDSFISFKTIFLSSTDSQYFMLIFSIFTIIWFIMLVISLSPFYFCKMRVLGVKL